MLTTANLKTKMIWMAETATTKATTPKTRSFGDDNDNDDDQAEERVDPSSR